MDIIKNKKVASALMLIVIFVCGVFAINHVTSRATIDGEPESGWQTVATYQSIEGSASVVSTSFVANSPDSSEEDLSRTRDYYLRNVAGSKINVSSDTRGREYVSFSSTIPADFMRVLHLDPNMYPCGVDCVPFRLVDDGLNLEKGNRYTTINGELDKRNRKLRTTIEIVWFSWENGSPDRYILELESDIEELVE